MFQSAHVLLQKSEEKIPRKKALNVRNDAECLKHVQQLVPNTHSQSCSALLTEYITPFN